MKPSIIKEYYKQHCAYWESKQKEMRELYLAYMTRFWKKNDNALMGNNENLIQTSRAYEFVEGYIASLFSKNPSVLTKEDMRGDGDPEVAKELVNKFLPQILKSMGQTSRRSITYDYAFLKLVPTEHPDPLRRVKGVSIQCWDMIIDTDAQVWEEIRFCGHRSWITIADAKKRYGNKQLQGGNKLSYIEGDKVAESFDPDNLTSTSDPELQYIEIVEWYDMQSGTMCVWSPNYSNGDKLLFDGIEVTVGVGENAKSVKFNKIPFKDHWGMPVCPIVPLYFSEDIDTPLRGYSALRRVYDQVQETNIIRTAQSNMIRKTSRQWIYDQEMLEEDSMRRLVAGIDGEYIPVKKKAGRRMQDAIMSVPHTPVPLELQAYVQQVKDDFDLGSIMAAFTRGESTRATATEITALASYTSSEVGRLARTRDLMIEEIARVYLCIYRVYIPEEGDSIIINGMPKKIQKKDLEGDFQFYANDMGSTPISEAVKKQEFLTVLPILKEHGINPTKLITHMINMLDLPTDFLSDLGGDQNVNEPTTPSAEALLQSAGMQGQPSPDDVEQFLPNQGMI